MKTLRIDFETRGAVQLNAKKKDAVGLHNYMTHASTSILMMAYKLPGSKTVELWQPHLGPMPEDLRTSLLDPKVFVAAYNSTFERYALQFKLGITIPPSRFIDPQVGSRYLAIPANLSDTCDILGLPKEFAKDERGKELIQLFCELKLTKKKKDEEQTTYFNDWNSHPKEWEEFGEYCKQDVVAEEEVCRRMELLQVLPLPPFERKLWEFDQLVNDRGMPVDIDFVKKAYKLASRHKKELKDKQNELTGLENANSTDQLLPWAQERGYPMGTLRKETLEATLKDPEVKLTELCREVLTLRLEAGSTSYTKLEAILRNVSADGRLRGQFIFLGSSRCGRWSGNAVQLHNIPRPNKIFEDQKNVIDARNLVYAEDYEGIKERFKDEETGKPGSVLLVVKNLLRTVFVAPKGDTNYRFNVADLASIETRVAAWLASCESLMGVFEHTAEYPQGRDAYLDFSSNITGIPYKKLTADLESKDPKTKAEAKHNRQVAKPGVLGAVYRLGGGDWGKNKHGDRIRTGLWGYAWNMQVEMTQEQAHMVVRTFRESYPEIPMFWKILEDAVLDVMHPDHPQTVRKVGPNGCVTIDRLNISDKDGNIGRSIMRMQLPSGRRLHYMDARLETLKMPWQKDGEDVYRDGLVYAGVDQVTKRWGVTTSHGGKEFENLVQGISRDVFAVKLLEFEAADMPVVGHSHDEGLALVPDDPFSPGAERMVEIMSTPIDWAPGLLLGADGFESDFYRK